MWKHIKQWGLGLGVLYVSACAIVYWQQARFIFAPSTQSLDTPTKFGKSYQEVWLQIKLPVLFLHGEADRRIPFAMSKRLFEASGSRHKQLHTFPGADHDDVAAVAGTAYTKVVMDFMNR